MTPAGAILAGEIFAMLAKGGAALMRLIAGGDADVERARLKKEGFLIDETESDAAKAYAESHYP